MTGENENLSLIESIKNDLRRLGEMLAIIKYMDKRKAIYDMAFASIGDDVSPDDLAPDEYACAESLSNIIRRALPELNFPIILSTRLLYAYFISSPSFQQTDTPGAGSIIINVTGTGNGAVSNGHTGVVGKNWIMSNDSRTGTWEANYLPPAWKRYFEIKGGMPTHYFDCV